MRRYRLHLALFAIGFAVYALAAGGRLWHQSDDPHYVYQADAWLHGRLAIDPAPDKGDDWARVETVLVAGEEVRGRRLQTRPMFRTTGGDEIDLRQVTRSLGKTTYMSFPPVPSLIMLPGAILGGRDGNDVFPTVLIAALCLPLMLLLLERLDEAGLAKRSKIDQLTLVALTGFGTVFFFSAVLGQVWYTAQIVGLALAIVFAWASIEVKRPLVAGLAYALAVCTRPAMMFMLPLAALEAWRMHRGERQQLVRKAILFGIPVVAIGAAMMAYNAARFGSPFEWGHSYLEVVQQQQIERWGLASYHYLGRNLAVALTLLPEWVGWHYPYVRVSGHGLALWVTTPAFLLVLWPRDKGPLHRALWLTVALVALPSLLYMNSGWFQFGYRFSLDYTVFLVMLLAVGGRAFGRGTRALVIASIVVNLFGAVTFERYGAFYRGDGDAKNVVVAN